MQANNMNTYHFVDGPSLIGMIQAPENHKSVRVTLWLMLIAFFFSVAVTPTMLAAAVDSFVIHEQNSNYSKMNSDSQHLFSESINDLSEKLNKLNKKQTTVLSGQIGGLSDISNNLEEYNNGIVNRFGAIEEHIKSKDLSDVVLQRHYDAVKSYNDNYKQLMLNLSEVTSAADYEQRDEKIDTVLDFLNEKPSTRKHQVFNPDNLPNQKMMPKSENKPKISKDEYLKNYSELLNRQNNEEKLDMGVAHPFLAIAPIPLSFSEEKYLAETPEVVLTESIIAKANELENDPVKIYHWVLNNVEWIPNWGAKQNADLTLSVLSGNSMDISSLLIALYRASGIPARYVHGTIKIPEEKFRNWAGGFDSIQSAGDYASSGGVPATFVIESGIIKDVKIEHIWVEVALDFFPSRSAKITEIDNWVPLDPSFKQYEYKPNVDVLEISGLNPDQLFSDVSGAIDLNRDEGWVSAFDTSVIDNLKQSSLVALNSYLNTHEMSELDDLLGDRRILIKQFPSIPSSLPNEIIVEGIKVDKLPNSLRDTMTFSFEKDLIGELINPISFSFAEINNKKIILSFKPASVEDENTINSFVPSGISSVSELPSQIPAYLINVKPELRIDDEVVSVGESMRLGDLIDFNYSISVNGGTRKDYQYSLSAGSRLAIPVFSNNVSSKILEDISSNMNEIREVIDSQDSNKLKDIDSKVVADEFLYAGATAYFDVLTTQAKNLAAIDDTHFNITIGYGSFGYEPKVNYLFGFPNSIQPGNAIFNINYLFNSASNDSSEAEINFNSKVGYVSSALEHIIPETLFSDSTLDDNNSFSAVKLHQKGLERGQRLYSVTADNLQQVLSSVNLSREVESEIISSVNSGLNVVVQSAEVVLNNWKGLGYIIIDPETGAGAYKISGGQNGGGFSMDEALGKVWQVIVILAKNTFLDIFDTLYSLIVNISELFLACSGGDLFANIFLLTLLSSIGFLVPFLLGFTFWFGLVFGIIFGYVLGKLVNSMLALCQTKEGI